jgi:hypothetical protein
VGREQVRRDVLKAPLASPDELAEAILLCFPA